MRLNIAPTIADGSTLWAFIGETCDHLTQAIALFSHAMLRVVVLGFNNVTKGIDDGCEQSVIHR
jgi:hypothetical protein